ncbi:JAB1/MPN/MOV34 metalloenzyme domain [Trypanosoma melophagium]|uniref:JAB1/MPN/MOV34 metalloenzyme domain n=1 Tax=Trypanosoma melophagium TaxID=715481 RepID=UPI00351A5CB2|nr:JAB1/MPN/MOV34 metalloenzyme domain [Trypanosoma melophagium]
MHNCVITDDTFSFPKTQEMRELHKRQPWKTSPHYFNKVKVSVLAAMQMMIHAKRGGPNVTHHSCSSSSTNTTNTTTNTNSNTTNSNSNNTNSVPFSSTLSPPPPPPPPTTTTTTTTTTKTTKPLRSTSVREPRRENWFEVMGLLLGHFRAGEMTVTGAFGLPVDASEVECSMNDASQLYMLDFLEYYQRGGIHQQQGYKYKYKQQGQGQKDAKNEEHEEEVEGCIGWYHSHPGYTCFLSGTDVNTQQLSQSAQDPWLAIVVDPVRTIATGRLDMKAFRTFPEAYAEELRGKQQQQQGRYTNTTNTTSTTVGRVGRSRNMNSNSSHSNRGLVPSARIREFGVHAYRYYELPITLVRSKNDEAQLDRLWCRYWALTFSTNPLISNRYFMTQQIHQLAGVLESSAGGGRRNTAGGNGGGFVRSGKQQKQKRQESQTNAREGALMDIVLDDNDDTNDDDDAFKQSCVQVRYLASSLASEVALGGTLMAVKNAAFLI